MKAAKQEPPSAKKPVAKHEPPSAQKKAKHEPPSAKKPAAKHEPLSDKSESDVGGGLSDTGNGDESDSLMGSVPEVDLWSEAELTL